MSSYTTSKNRKSTFGGMLKTVLAVVGSLIVVGVIFAFSTSSVATGPNQVALHIGGGPIESAHFKDCVPASTRQNFNSPGDKYVTYTTSQRDWDATGQAGSDSEPFQIVSKDNVTMTVPIIVRFYQITDCKTLQRFYDNLGQRYNAYINSDGSGSQGWEIMVRKIVADPVDVELNSIAQKYDWLTIRNDPAVRNEIANSLRNDIVALVKRNAQGDYFDNFSVLVKKPEPTDPTMLQRINTAQGEIYAAEAAQKTAAAQKAQAEAEIAVAKAQAAKKVAEILGFKLPGMTSEQAVAAYNQHFALEQKINPWQPQGGSLLQEVK